MKDAKTKLLEMCDPNEDCPVRKGSNFISSQFSDIISLLIARHTTGDLVPTFVIELPTEVTCLPATAYSSLFVKINQLHQTVIGMSSSLDNYQLKYPKLPLTASTADTDATIVVQIYLLTFLIL